MEGVTCTEPQFERRRERERRFDAEARNEAVVTSLTAGAVLV